MAASCFFSSEAATGGAFLLPSKAAAGGALVRVGLCTAAGLQRVVSAAGRGGFSSGKPMREISAVVAAAGRARAGFSSEPDFEVDPKDISAVAAGMHVSALRGKLGRVLVVYASVESTAEVDDGLQVSADGGGNKTEGGVIQVLGEEEVAQLIKNLLNESLSMLEKMEPLEGSEIKTLREDYHRLVEEVEMHGVGQHVPGQLISLHKRIGMALGGDDAAPSLSPIPASIDLSTLLSSMSQAEHGFFMYKQVGGSVAGEDGRKEDGDGSTD